MFELKRTGLYPKKKQIDNRQTNKQRSPNANIIY